MKILFVHALAESELGGGAEVIVWEQMRGLRDVGHECVLLAISDKHGLVRTEREGITVWKAGIRNVYWPFHKKRPAVPWRLVWHALDSYNPWMQGFLREVVMREKPDLASLHNLPGWSAASWQTLTHLGIPAVQVLHDYYPICVKSTMYKKEKNCTSQCPSCRMFRLPHRKLSQNLSAVVGVSRFILDRHLSLGYFEDVPIQRVIHNARSAEALGIDEATAPNSYDGLRFGYIGRLDRAKGVESLIDAFLAAGLPETELWIAGSGRQHEEDHLRNKMKEARVRFLERVAPRDFYSQVDVVVVPSLWNEPLGMVVAEALAFGKPVIGSRRGGIPEMITNGENGLLFEPDTPGELQRAIESMGDGELRARLTSQARPSAEPFIDMAGWIRAYEALFQELTSS